MSRMPTLKSCSTTFIPYDRNQSSNKRRMVKDDADEDVAARVLKDIEHEPFMLTAALEEQYLLEAGLTHNAWVHFQGFARAAISEDLTKRARNLVIQELWKIPTIKRPWTTFFKKLQNSPPTSTEPTFRKTVPTKPRSSVKKGKATPSQQYSTGSQRSLRGVHTRSQSTDSCSSSLAPTPSNLPPTPLSAETSVISTPTNRNIADFTYWMPDSSQPASGPISITSITPLWPYASEHGPVAQFSTSIPVSIPQYSSEGPFFWPSSELTSTAYDQPPESHSYHRGKSISADHSPPLEGHSLISFNDCQGQYQDMSDFKETSIFYQHSLDFSFLTTQDPLTGYYAPKDQLNASISCLGGPENTVGTKAVLPPDRFEDETIRGSTTCVDRVTAADHANQPQIAVDLSEEVTSFDTEVWLKEIFGTA